MIDARDDRFDRLRDSIVAHLEQFELRISAQIQEQGARLDALTERVDALSERVDALTERVDSLSVRSDSLSERLDLLRAEMVERFESVDERFRAMELRLTLFENRVSARLEAFATELAGLRADSRLENESLKRHVAALEANFTRLQDRLDALETGVSSWAASTAGLADDMRQRMRVVNDRLAGSRAAWLPDAEDSHPCLGEPARRRPAARRRANERVFFPARAETAGGSNSGTSRVPGSPPLVNLTQAAMAALRQGGSF